MQDNFDEKGFEAAMDAAEQGNTTPQTPVTEIVEPTVATTETVVDTPVVETTIDTPPTTDTPQDAPTIAEKIVEVEKVVEKIVEKYPDFKDEHAKALFEAIRNGNEDEVYDYLREKKRDYGTMSDLDIVRTNIKKAHPSWTSSEVELDVRKVYGEEQEKIDLTTIDKELEPDDYRQAEIHNRRVEQNALLLSRDARDLRQSLIANQRNIELPSITQETPANVPQQPTATEIEEANRRWEEVVTTEVPKLTDLKLKVGDEEVTYTYTAEEKTAHIEKMKNFNTGQYFKERGWINEDGTQNVLKIAEDVHKLDNFEKIQKSFGTQLLNKGKKEVIQSIKNVDTNRASAPITSPNSLADAFYDAG